MGITDVEGVVTGPTGKQATLRAASMATQSMEPDSNSDGALQAKINRRPPSV